MNSASTGTNTRMDGADRIFLVWALVLPISSVLLIPSIQGTTPGFLISLLALGLVPFVARGQRGYYRVIGYFAVFCLLMACASQVGIMTGISNPDTTRLTLINPTDSSVYFRSTLFTQSLYLFCGVSLFSFVVFFYKGRWDNYLFAGAILLALHGLYEWGYYLATGSFGDFLSNRSFDTESAERVVTGFQEVQIGPLTMQRLKSLTGEPSMYAFTILPFWIYATHCRRWVISAILLVTLLLSTSTTAMLGILIYFISTLLDRRGLALKMVLVVVALIGCFWFQDYLWELFDFLFGGKMSSESGDERAQIFWDQIHFFLQADLWTQLFGLGFGYTRSPDFFSTLLVNFGVIGTLVTMVFLLWPVFRLENTRQANAIRLAVIVIFVTLMVSVPEFSYLSLWLFLGMAYAHLRQQRLRAAAKISNQVPTSEPFS